MDNQPDLFLTEERIRAVVREAPAFYKKARSRAGKTMLPPPTTMPNIEIGETIIDVMGAQIDATIGAGGGRFLADSSRLLYLLSVLAKGSVEDAIAFEQRRMARMDASLVRPEMAELVRGNQRIIESRLRAIPQSEVDAVMACLDEIETVYRAQVIAVRARHDPADRAKRLEAATGMRVEDSSRPQLTVDRVRRVLDVLEAVVPGPKMVVRTLHEPGFVLQGQAAAKMFPATTVKKIRAQGEEPEDFARDYAWLRIISDHIGRGDTIDDRLREMVPYQSADAWRIAAHAPGVGRARAERFAAATRGPIELLSRVGRDEEGAVKSLLEEVQSRLRAMRELQMKANYEKDKQRHPEPDTDAGTKPQAIEFWISPSDDGSDR
jgi:hypothetical protein